MHRPRHLLVFAGLFVFAMGGAFAQGPKAGEKDKDKDKDGPAKTAAQGATPAVGELTLDYDFKNMISGDGRTSLKAFRGSVILHDWWGIH